jgi:transcription elongation factor Elf1
MNNNLFYLSKPGRCKKLNQLTEKSIECPYCGETIEVLIDSSDMEQQYIEDCQVCCKPISFLVFESVNSDLSVRVYSEDEAF